MKLLHLGWVAALAAAASITSCKTVKTAQAEPMEERDLPAITVTPETNAVDEVPTSLPTYNPSYTRTNDLLHTKLEVSFDWNKQHVLGKAWIDAQPLFYPTNQLVLDAKGFDIHDVKVNNRKAKYEYKNDVLTIDLGKKFTSKEKYQVYVDYTAKPNERTIGGSDAITSDKGLFFINPLNNEGDKPQQIWTQGETESNSAWFPTVDKPNERMTEEIYMTVQDKYKTLSNGLLKSSKKNSDGTRTDHWVMDMPHAPYLVMMTVGDFAVVEDKWNSKLLQYIVEPEYKDDAKAIFNNTKEMLTFFSDFLGVKYPWQKYSQVVVRDYVSGAMENTTAVIFGDFVQNHKRELIDNHNDRIVAHEMMHHWFGDLVTCESWANLTMNEGFANYSEYLWMEHKYGRDEADHHLLSERQGYYGSAAQSGTHPLIDFGYESREDMFDGHSYNKGGAILHMLRKEIGDEAFRAGLKKYLSEHKFESVEAHDLRLAFEEITGRDLNWFFNQWYFEQGHPTLDIKQNYDATNKEVVISIEQTQNPKNNPAIYVLPIEVDIYTKEGQKPTREKIVVNKRKQTFRIKSAQAPKLVNLDAERSLLAIKGKYKTEDELVFQYFNAPLFADRLEALESLKESNSAGAKKVKEAALKDPFWAIRNSALTTVSTADNPQALAAIENIAKNDTRSQVQSAAILALAKTGDSKYASIAKSAINSNGAYNVVAAGLEALNGLNPTEALSFASKLEGEKNSSIISSVSGIYAASKSLDKLSYFENNLSATNGYSAVNFFKNYASLAMLGDASQMLKSGKVMKDVALNMSQSPWRRFAATSAIDALYQKLKGGDATKAMALKTIIGQIKGAETNSQLKSLYQQLGK